jgi:hypothetical protein
VVQEIDLLKLVIEVDDELIQQRVAPCKRPLKAYLKISNRLQPGSSYIFQDDPIFHAVNQIYSDLYRPSDLHLSTGQKA